MRKAEQWTIVHCTLDHVWKLTFCSGTFMVAISPLAGNLILLYNLRKRNIRRPMFIVNCHLAWRQTRLPGDFSDITRVFYLACLSSASRVGSRRARTMRGAKFETMSKLMYIQFDINLIGFLSVCTEKTFLPPLWNLKGRHLHIITKIRGNFGEKFNYSHGAS